MMRTKSSLAVFLFVILVFLIPGVLAQKLPPIPHAVAIQEPPILATEAASRFVGGPEFTPIRIDVDATGNIYVAGTNRAPNDHGDLIPHVELYKFNPQFEQVFRLPLEGNGIEQVNDMAMDPAGNIYLAGSTTSTDFPTMNPVQAQMNGGADVFLTKVDSDGNMLFSTYLGGSNADIPNVLTVDADGNAVIGGKTGSSDFPSTPGAYMPEFNPPSTATSEPFVAKIVTESSTLEYSTAFGGGVQGSIYGIVEVSGGDVFLVASLGTNDFPVTDGSGDTGSHQVLARLSADGSELVYASYAPTSDGLVTNLILNRDGNPVLVGYFSAVTIDAATNTVLSHVGGHPDENVFFGGHVVMDADGNLIGGGPGSVPSEVVDKYVYPLGGGYVIKAAPDGSTLFSTALPTNLVLVATGPDGAIYAVSTSGMLIRFFPDQSDPSKVLPRMLGIANAAGPDVSSRIAPGELLSLYGPSIGSQTAATTEIGSDGLVTTSLGGVEVHFNGTPGRMLYSGPLQVNVAAPFVWGQGDSVLVEVFHDGDLWSSMTLHPIDADPGVFRSQLTLAAAYNQDQTLNSQNNPAAPGSIVTIFLSGTGAMTGASYQDGQVFDPSTPLADLPAPKLPVAVLSGPARTTTADTSAPTTLEILYAGQTPSSLAGIIQVNFRLPAQPPPTQNSFTEGFYLTVGDSFPPVPFSIWVVGAQ